MVFLSSLSDSKSPQVSRILPSILAIFNNAVVLLISTRSPTSKSSRPFNNPFVTVPKAPLTIGAIVTFMFHSFSDSLARSRYLSFFSHSFSFILWSARTAKCTNLQILFFSLIIIIIIIIIIIYIKSQSFCPHKTYFQVSFPSLSTYSRNSFMSSLIRSYKPPASKIVFPTMIDIADIFIAYHLTKPLQSFFFLDNSSVWYFIVIFYIFYLYEKTL